MNLPPTHDDDFVIKWGLRPILMPFGDSFVMQTHTTHQYQLTGG